MWTRSPDFCVTYPCCMVTFFSTQSFGLMEDFLYSTDRGGEKNPYQNSLLPCKSFYLPFSLVFCQHTRSKGMPALFPDWWSQCVMIAIKALLPYWDHLRMDLMVNGEGRFTQWQNCEKYIWSFSLLEEMVWCKIDSLGINKRIGWFKGLKEQAWDLGKRNEVRCIREGPRCWDPCESRQDHQRANNTVEAVQQPAGGMTPPSSPCAPSSTDTLGADQWGRRCKMTDGKGKWMIFFYSLWTNCSSEDCFSNTFLTKFMVSNKLKRTPWYLEFNKRHKHHSKS